MPEYKNVSCPNCHRRLVAPVIGDGAFYMIACGGGFIKAAHYLAVVSKADLSQARHLMCEGE